MNLLIENIKRNYMGTSVLMACSQACEKSNTARSKRFLLAVRRLRDGHLAITKTVGTINAEKLLIPKTHIMDSAHGNADANRVICTDNCGAPGVLAGQG